MGRKIKETKSSIFSTTAMAKPPSCGMIRPAMKPPKMGWTPDTMSTGSTLGTETHQ